MTKSELCDLNDFKNQTHNQKAIVPIEANREVIYQVQIDSYKFVCDIMWQQNLPFVSSVTLTIKLRTPNSLGLLWGLGRSDIYSAKLIAVKHFEI